MPRPDVAGLTDRMYDQLPATYRDHDEPLGYPLLRWLSLLLDEADSTTTLLARWDPATGPSHLTDPDLADVDWLPWLAQLVGAYLEPGLGETAMRDAVRDAVAGFQVGTKAAVANAARSALTGTRYVKVHAHSVTAPSDGGQWDVLLITRDSETPDVAAVLDAVVAKRAKPAGVVLHHRAYTATWAAVQTDFPTWADWNGKTWGQIQEAGL
jgi:hypothetical protein